MVIQDGKIVERGTIYYPHADEWVDVIPVSTLNTYLIMQHLTTAQGKRIEEIEVDFTELLDTLAHRVLAWNWTDIVGEPLPQPYKNAKILRDLEATELLWLASAAQGEIPVERKNGSEPLPTTSLAKGRSRKKSS